MASTIKPINLTYTCFACPPEPIKLHGGYTLGKDKDGYYITDGNLVLHYDYDFIKMLFTPIDSKWEDITF